MHAYIHENIQAYIHTCINTYIHTYMHTCIYTYRRQRHGCSFTPHQEELSSTGADQLPYTHTCMHTYIHTGGNAMAILSHHIKKSSVAQVLINYPEPPAWSGGGGESHTHMLSASFLERIHHVLMESGTLTILSDNLG